MMVDGDLYDANDSLRHISEFKGKFILLDFWSSGCGPCVESIPEMEKVMDLYKDKMTVISISEDPKARWKEYIKTKGMGGNQWNELRKGRTGLALNYQVRGIPHYVLIAPDGKIQDVWSGYGSGSLLALHCSLTHCYADTCITDCNSASNYRYTVDKLHGFKYKLHH